MYIDLSEYSEFSRKEFTADGLLVTIPRRITDFSSSAGSCRVILDALVCQKDSIVISALMQGRSFQFTGTWDTMFLQLDVLGDSTLRLRLARGHSLPEKNLPMLNPLPRCENDLSWEDKGLYYELKTIHMRVVLYKDPYRLEVFGADGRLLYRQYNNDAHNVTSDRRRGHCEEGKEIEDNSELSFPGFEVFPFGMVHDPASGKQAYTESVEVRPDEHFYGFGERFSPLDKRGQELLNWVINPVGVSNQKAYKCVPFFLSSRGYGVYYNTLRKVRFSMCDYFFKAYACEVQDDLLDFFLFVGDKKSILRDYAQLTGRSQLPPKWAFGVWMSRNCYRTQEEVESVACQLREEQLPCDVMHIDWDYCKTYNYDFAFDRTRFPAVEQMSQRLLERGIRLSVWQLPYVKEEADTYIEATTEGYLALEADGQVADTQAHEGVIDLSNPKALAWYQEKLKGLLRQGIRVIKTDFGENAQECYCYHSVDGKDMHNLYPYLYQKAAYEACQQIHPGDSLVWGRSAYTGSQRYPVCWGGDSDSDYNGMYHSLRGGLSLGLSGFQFWSHDVGGYFCTPEPNVYIRWLQFGMLSPLVRFHGTSPREPWAFGETAVEQYRRYAALRYALMEYLFSEAQDCINQALPMLRALTLEFDRDPAACGVDDEYLLGSSLLIAPVFSDDPSRMVYLPEGVVWTDLFSGRQYEGGRYYEISTPIEITPVFLRGGHAIPFRSPTQYVDERPVDKLTWFICPQEGEADYRLHTADGDIVCRCCVNGTCCTLEYQGGDGIEMHVRIYGAHVDTIICGDRELFVTRHEGYVAAQL